MKRLNTLATVALVFAGVASYVGNGVAQQKPLKEQLVGTWTLASQNVTLTVVGMSRLVPIQKACSCSMQTAASPYWF